MLFEQLEGELPAELRETVGRLMLAKLPDDRNPDYSGLNGILRGTVLGTQADVSR